jgi:hypothetical protein
MVIGWLKHLPFEDLTRFNGFELLAWDFNPSGPCDRQLAPKLNPPAVSVIRRGRLLLVGGVVEFGVG